MTEWLKDLLPSRPQNIKFRYSLKLDDYISVLEKQECRCAICGTRFAKSNRPCVDHCHENGHVRGLLCGLCNRGIGNLGDTLEIVASAKTYLNKDRKLIMQKPTQAAQVLSYLRSRKRLTQSTASSLYGISRLAAVVWRLNKQGHNIVTTLKDGVKGKYAEYSLDKSR